MDLSFNKIKFDRFDNVEKPILVLKSLDGSNEKIINDAKALRFALKYADVSEMSFDVSKGSCAVYDEIVGMKMVSTNLYGDFILIDPSVTEDGLKATKSCTAYSMEYEWNFKSIFIPAGTYNFYNPVDMNETIVGFIKEAAPGWNVGEIDIALTGKYRTFDQVDPNLYSFVTGTVQTAYNCIFIFDNVTKTFHVKRADKPVTSLPICLSFDNLLKEAQVRELSDELATCLSVYGADPVSIRSVNPTGTNKIYNLDYFIRNGSMSPALAAKWRLWESAFESAQDTYSGLMTAYNMKLTEKIAEDTELNQLKKDLWSLEQQKAAIVEATSAKVLTGDELKEINGKIRAKQEEIRIQTEKVEETKRLLDQLGKDKVEINNQCSFARFFSMDELRMINSYFKEDTMQDQTFVITENDYASGDISGRISENSNARIHSSIVSNVSVDPLLKKKILDARGGSFSADLGSNKIEGKLVSLTMQIDDTSNGFLLSAFLNKSIVNGKDFPSANISMKGALHTFSHGGTSIAFRVSSGVIYCTKGVTEYQQQSVEKELYDFAKDALNKIAYPSYEFTITSGNFLFAKEFEPFKDALEFGSSVVLELMDGLPIFPIFIGTDIDYESAAEFSMTFSSKYKASDGAFSLVDILGQSVKTAATVDFNKYNYSAFKDSGAKSQVKDFMTSALDVSKNAILSSGGQAISWDDTGFHLRAHNEDKTGYLPEQISMINNNIVFTSDGWETAQMAIGKFYDKNLGHTTGIVAPNIVGTLLAGENLVIENTSPEGKNVQFKVDGTGVYLNNSRFLTSYGSTQIAIDPSIGIVIGKNPVYDVDPTTNTLRMREDAASLYADTEGNLTVKGTIYATDGKFTGEVNATSGKFKGIVQASQFLDSMGRDMMTANGQFDAKYLDIMNINVKNSLGQTVFKINETGIDWNIVNSDPDIAKVEQVAVSAVSKAELARQKAEDAAQKAIALANGEIKGTFINGTSIMSPNIIGANITGVNLVSESASRAKVQINGGAINFFSGSSHYGTIKYDGNGYGDSVNPDRMFITSAAGKALKLESGGDMSIAANGKIYIGNCVFTGSVSGGNLVAKFG